jgi:hypothetical protein
MLKYQLESWYDAMLPGEMQQSNAGNDWTTIHYTNQGTMEAAKYTKGNPGPATTTGKRERN